jgi:formylglycine-generating enzyme required for sulfatase activity
MISDWRQVTPGNGGGRGGKFSVGYYELSRYVRRPGIESDYHMLEPMEFHANTTQLVQMLEQGHYGVRLGAEAWDRLNTWIDLNCPYHGTWQEATKDPGQQRNRRRELLQRYGGYDDDPEAIVATRFAESSPSSAPPPVHVEQVTCPDWPFDAAEARARQQAAGANPNRTIDLGKGMELSLALIPAGEFVMGDPSATGRPARRERIDKPFWIGQFEITNAQFNLFDPDHDSRVETKNAYQFGIHGYPMNRPEQPVVRVTWNAAMEFCQWLSKRTGERFVLPSEAQWEYACRAGTATAFNFGGPDADFSQHANMADATMRLFASDPYTVDRPLKNPSRYDDWIPRDDRFDDGSLLSVAPGRYAANAWGLHDMHGNVGEWTRTRYVGGGVGRPSDDRRVVRGGSWRDRPLRCTSAFAVGYHTYQPVYNVGFRVVCEVEESRIASLATP